MENSLSLWNFFNKLYTRLVQEGILSNDLELPSLCYQSTADMIDSCQADWEVYTPVNFKDWWGNLSSWWKLSEGGQNALSLETKDLLEYWFNGPRDREPLQLEVHPSNIARIIRHLMVEGSANQIMSTQFAQASTALLACCCSQARLTQQGNTSTSGDSMEHPSQLLYGQP